MKKIYRQLTRLITGIFFIAASLEAHSQWFFDAEVGGLSASRNKVQIPNDNEGDRFEITDLGDDVFPVARLTLGWQPSPNHELQLVYAPLSYSEEGTFDEDIRFDGVSFSSDETVEARYTFNSYRLRYLYQWIDESRWKLAVGGTLFVRDASIKLSQNGTNSRDTNLGLVPLFALRAEYSFKDDWSLLVDTDFAFAPQGRAIDLALLANHKINRHWSIAGGYRTIEGGADNDDIYNFAWFNGFVLKTRYQW